MQTDASIPNAETTLEELAHRIHAAYCGRCVKVSFETFKNEWQQAARNAIECQADPEEFVRLLEGWSNRLDPEDLAAPSAAPRYRKYAAIRDRMFIGSFEYAVTWFGIRAHQHGLRYALGDLAWLFSDLDEAFRVTAAKMWSESKFEEVVRICGRAAVETLRSSPKLRRYITRRCEQHGIDGDALLADVERVLARQSEEDRQRLDGAVA